jgi:hypothetical protein
MRTIHAPLIPVLRPGKARVLSSHRHALNLLLDGGEVLSLVDGTVGNGPGALVLDDQPVPRPTGDLCDLVKALWNGAAPWHPPAAPPLQAAPAAVEAVRECLQDHGDSPGLLPVVLDGRPDSPLHTLALEGIAALRVGQWAQAARRLAGLGPGLTPSGDDLLGGFALLLARARHPAAPALDAALAALPPGATTPFSRHLLDWAVRGVAGEHHLAWADSLLAGRPTGPDRVLACGATSGADWAAGALLALEHLVKGRDHGDPTLRPLDSDRHRHAGLAQL